MAGWGIADTGLTDLTPAIMKFGTSKVANCQIVNNAKVFCIGYSGNDSVQYHVGSAAGDSGGPAWVENDNGLKITGVVSGGSGPTTRSGSPGFFTKISIFRPWIDSIMSVVVPEPTSIISTNWSDNDIRIGIDNKSAKIFFGSIDATLLVCNIYSTTGQKLYHSEIENPSQSTHLVDMGNFAAGMYVVYLYSPGNSKQFIKKIYKSY